MGHRKYFGQVSRSASDSVDRRDVRQYRRYTIAPVGYSFDKNVITRRMTSDKFSSIYREFEKTTLPISSSASDATAVDYIVICSVVLCVKVATYSTNYFLSQSAFPFECNLTAKIADSGRYKPTGKRLL